jgi:PAS domain S-box-containing protein
MGPGGSDGCFYLQRSSLHRSFVNQTIRSPNLAPDDRTSCLTDGDFRDLIDCLGEPVVVVSLDDPEHRIAHVNAAFTRMTGYALEESIGRRCCFLQGAQTDGDAVAAVHAALKAGRAATIEMISDRRAGAAFASELSLTPAAATGRAPRWCVGLYRDVSQIRQQQDAAALAQRMATVGQLTAGIAHDLNHLVTGLLGTTELLVVESAEHPALNAMARMLQETARQTGMHLRRLTSMARQSPGRPEAVDLPSLLEHLVRFLRPMLGKGVRLPTHVEPDARTLTAEPVELEAALLNLVLNARDALPGAGHIPLACRRTDGASPCSQAIELSVEDNGSGMPAEVLEQATQAFFTTKGAGRGTGLGLTMVQGFVAQSGGQLSISSRVGLGTRVAPLLPDASPCRPVAPHPPPAGSRRAAVSGDRSMRVAVVDDDPVVRMTTLAMLGRLGHRVNECDSGDSARQALQSGQLDAKILVTDQIMPGSVDGLGLIASLRQWRPQIAAILATASAPELAESLPGDITLLSKPYGLAELERALRQALDLISADRLGSAAARPVSFKSAASGGSLPDRRVAGGAGQTDEERRKAPCEEIDPAGVADGRNDARHARLAGRRERPADRCRAAGSGPGCGQRLGVPWAAPARGPPALRIVRDRCHGCTHQQARQERAGLPSLVLHGLHRVAESRVGDGRRGQ